jgi:hypothetical protein
MNNFILALSREETLRIEKLVTGTCRSSGEGDLLQEGQW